MSYTTPQWLLTIDTYSYSEKHNFAQNNLCENLDINTMEDEDENFEEETGAPWDDLMNEDVPSMDPNDVNHTQLCCSPRISH